MTSPNPTSISIENELSGQTRLEIELISRLVGPARGGDADVHCRRQSVELIRHLWRCSKIQSSPL